MNDFNKRVLKSEELVNRFCTYLTDNSIPFLKSGYEFNVSVNNGLEIIRNMTDVTSKFVRYYPDFTMMRRDKSVLVEVKNSTGIEKECWDNYKTLQDSLGLTILFYLKNDKLCRLNDVKFIPIDGYDPIADMQIPVTDGIWKEPRMLSDYEYSQYMGAYQQAKRYTSGCSFAFIDFNSTNFYDREVLR